MKRPRPLVLSILVLALLAVALTISAVGCGSGKATSTETTSATQASTEAPTSVTEPSGPPNTAPNPGETSLGNGRVGGYGYIEQVVALGSYHAVHVIYVEILTGEEATAAAIEDGELQPGEELPNDYYIRKTAVLPEDTTNVDVGRLTAPGNDVSPTVEITTYTFGDGGEQTLTWEEWASLYDGSRGPVSERALNAIWWIERDERGPILSIKEHILP